jgi:Fe-S-cluster containining protein
MVQIVSRAAAPAQRECGSCGMCCKLFHIPAVEKPAGKWCRHWAAGAGCSIHPNRPAQCREFFCLWMTDISLADIWKPERSRIVLSIFPGNGFLYAQVDAASPQAWRKQPYFDDLRRMAAALQELNRRVIVFVGENATLVTPQGATPLGRMSPDDTFVVEPAFGPDGPTFRVSRTQALDP